jgi:hypothetical protein
MSVRTRRLLYTMQIRITGITGLLPRTIHPCKHAREWSRCFSSLCASVAIL